MTTKEKLIKSALALFVERGIDNTPTALITKEAGFSEATLFVHFKSKQGLIDAIYLDSKQRQLEAFAEVPVTKEDAKKSLHTLYIAGVEYFIAHYDEALFLDRVFATSHVSAGAKKKIADESQAFVQIFTTWKKQNDIKDISLDFYNRLIWSALLDMTEYCRSKKLKTVPKHLESVLWDTLKR